MSTPAKPEVFIQWKGTTVCMDWSCTCGAEEDSYHYHFDGDFAYAVRCPRCGKVWELPHTLTLTASTLEAHPYAQLPTSSSLIETEGELVRGYTEDFDPPRPPEPTGDTWEGRMALRARRRSARLRRLEAMREAAEPEAEPEAGGNTTFYSINIDIDLDEG